MNMNKYMDMDVDMAMDTEMDMDTDMGISEKKVVIGYRITPILCPTDIGIG
jgi:hypothetical protein